MDRLIARRLFPLALEISEFLKLSSVGRSRVLAHWTIYKVETSTSEEGETARQVSSRLELSSDIPYSDTTPAMELESTAPAIDKMEFFEIIIRVDHRLPEYQVEKNRGAEVVFILKLKSTVSLKCQSGNPKILHHKSEQTFFTSLRESATTNFKNSSAGKLNT